MISFIFSKVPPAHSKGNDNYQLKRKHLPVNGENFNKLGRFRFSQFQNYSLIVESKI
jgi:hypothetical protein